MGHWKPTIGKWNDDENYTMMPTMWQTALEFVNKQYTNAEVYWEYKDGLEIKKEPYIKYVQSVLSTFINEANIKSDDILAFVALARLNEYTGCPFEEIEKVSYKYIVEEIKALPKHTPDDMMGYYKTVLDGDYKYTSKALVAAELLCTLRAGKCPKEDWEQDLKYYRQLEELIDSYLSKPTAEQQSVLWYRIKDQIAENMDISRNRNKKPEELFAGMEDFK